MVVALSYLLIRKIFYTVIYIRIRALGVMLLRSAYLKGGGNSKKPFDKELQESQKTYE
jgi:hypothetical protein